MALPKVSTATYTLKIPSSGKEVTYRPFLVKEEKQLLMAMESNDTKVMAKAMSNIVSACTEEEIDMDEFPLAEGPHQVVLGGGQEGQVQTGVIAQEIEDILPECIRVSEKGAKTVNNDPITWALVNAVKELSTQNDALKARLDAAGL